MKGVKQEVVNMSDGCLEIPQFGTKHSLNVSTTAGIVMWDLRENCCLNRRNQEKYLVLVIKLVIFVA